MLQLHAGYVVEEIIPFLNKAAGEAGGVGEKTAEKQVRALLRELSCFEVTGLPPGLPPPLNPPPTLLAVAVNLLSRGLPSRLPLSPTKIMLEALWPGAKYDRDKLRQGSLVWELGAIDRNFGSFLWRALHLIDPRLRDEPATRTAIRAWPELGSPAEKDFLTNLLPRFDPKLGPLLWQVLEPQASLRGVLEDATDEDTALQAALRQPAQSFTGQSLDFALALPYAARYPEEEGSSGPRGLILEVDGGQHEEAAQSLKDKSRDAAAREAQWLPVRLPTDQFAAPEKALRPLRSLLDTHPYLQRLAENYTDPLLTTPDGLRALQLLLTPLAVARVQRVLLACMQNGLLAWERPRWRIGVLERDVPCAHLAVAGLRELLADLFALEGAGRKLPKIDLQVWGTAGFSDAELRRLPGHGVRVFSENQPPTGSAFDLLLDVSVLQRPGFSAAPAAWPAAARITLRSAHRPHAVRQFQTAPLIRYPALVQTDDRKDEYEYPVAAGAGQRVAALRRLLRNVFRKTNFRPGQLPILSRALQGESVLGLLPTGGGKSMTYTRREVNCE